MSYEEGFSIAVGVLNVAVVLVLAFHVRRLGIRPPLPLVMLAIVFAVRAAARLVPPLGEDPKWLTLTFDSVLLVVLTAFLATARSLVTSIAQQRDELQQAQVDYDSALSELRDEPAADA